MTRRFYIQTLKETSPSSTVAYASFPEADDLGNSTSEAAVESSTCQQPTTPGGLEV